MSESVLVAIIAGCISLFGTVLTIIATNHKQMADFKVAQEKQMADFKVGQALTKQQIEELTREVRAHNGFAQRMPVVEEQIKVANHRIEDLEKKVG